MKTIVVKGSYSEFSDGYDGIYIDNKYIFSTSECNQCPEDAVYYRDIRDSFSVINLAKTLFKEAGLNFDDYFEVIDEVEREQ